jgi:hypothetical protein
VPHGKEQELEGDLAQVPVHELPGESPAELPGGQHICEMDSTREHQIPERSIPEEGAIDIVYCGFCFVKFPLNPWIKHTSILPFQIEMNNKYRSIIELRAITYKCCCEY